MSKSSGVLTEDEVRQISRIVEILNKSTFDYLQLEIGELKLTIGRGDVMPGASNVEPQRVPVQAATPQAAVDANAAEVPPRSAQKKEVEDGLVDVVAPVVGLFYSQPEPGAAKFVSMGSEVKEDTTVGLIETMKMFSAVLAGVRGTIAEINVQDSTLVESGQVLFRVRPK